MSHKSEPNFGLPFKAMVVALVLIFLGISFVLSFSKGNLTADISTSFNFIETALKKLDSLP